MIALGALLARGGLLRTEIVRGLNRLIYYVSLPALLFIGTATADLRTGEVGISLAIITVALVCVGVLAVLYARLAGLGLLTGGTFVHVCVRANLSFVGLPVALHILSTVPASGSMKSMCFLILAPFILLQNLLGLVVLLAGQHRWGWSVLWLVAKELALHPVLLSTAGGAAVSLTGVQVPMVLTRSLDSLGATASPLALLVIGAALLQVPIRGRLGTALAASFMKVAVMPLIGWFGAWWLGVPPTMTMIILVMLACPTGASSFSIVAEMKGDQALASSVIVLTHLLCALPLALVVAWFHP